MKHDSNSPGTGVAPALMHGASVLGQPALVATWRRAGYSGRPVVRIFDAPGVDEGVFIPASSIAIIGSEELTELQAVISRALVNPNGVSFGAKPSQDDGALFDFGGAKLAVGGEKHRPDPDEMVALLGEAAGLFRMYEVSHRGRGPEHAEKAAKNKEIADRIEALLGGAA